MLSNDFILIKYDDHSEMYMLKYATFLVDIGYDEFECPATRHVYVRKVMDGGMVEFYHVDSNELAGSMGIEAFKRAIRDGEVGVVDKVGYVEFND